MDTYIVEKIYFKKRTNRKKPQKPKNKQNNT